MCWLGRVSRAGYYRHLRERHPEEEATEARAAMQEIAVAHRRRYGYRRIGPELRKRGMLVNHKRLVGMMREDNLLAIRHRRYVLTTDSTHELEVYLNLAGRMTLTAPNQLWIADLTYIRLNREFVYLAVILDKWSRRVVGSALGRSLAARLVVTALERAVAERHPAAGLVHHSDRGIQYASEEYARLLKAHQITPSMSRPANPYDNATCESFMKTLKQEEIYCRRYRDLEDLEAHLEEFLDRYYNRQRMHSALGYRTPVEFEQQAAATGPDLRIDAPKMSFFRHGKSINPMSDSGTGGGPDADPPPPSFR